MASTEHANAGRRQPHSPDRAIRHTAERISDSAFFFDFDGTLAEIEDDPRVVKPVPGALKVIGELARQAARVAIVSARPVDFLHTHFAELPEVSLYGLYGLEWQIDGGRPETHPEAAAYAQIMQDLAKRAAAELPPAAGIEYKRLSLALHYRQAPQHGEAVERWANQRAAELGLRAQAGRMVIELKPLGDRDKGSVVGELITDVGCAWFFGDDVADLRAFAALDQRESTDQDFFAVRVAVANPESGMALRAAADLGVEGPAHVPDLLIRLLDSIQR